MRSKTPLALMEQVIMVLVFALAAALCLRAFVLADRISRTCEERDRAVSAIQTVAETLKHVYGDFDEAERMAESLLEDVDVVFCSGDQWTANQHDSMTVVVCPVENETALMGCAEITAYDSAAKSIITLTVGWQEVGSHG